MKKTLYILLVSVAVLTGCMREEDPLGENRRQWPEAEGRVLVRMSIDMPELNPSTRALSDTPNQDLTSIHIAVFGRSGYLKEYVEAVMEQNPTANGQIGGNTNRYTFYATLALSENSERHIHILGNGPEIMEYAKETEILDTLHSPYRKGGYWQSFIVPGIKAARDSDGNLIGEDTITIGGETVHLGTGTFQISDETAAYFEDIPLIRNFAKIVVEDGNDSNFETISFAAINTATRGSMAPYYSEGFVFGYEGKSYTQLVDMGYPAKLPPNTEFDSFVPLKTSFQNPAGRSDVASASGSYFMYERPIPNENQPATVVVIYGHFTDPDTDDGVDDSGYYFYKVDLMENGVYYPIYRNFKYRISIEKILKPGADTPEDALRSMGSGDVSADISTQKITDISDGTSRILVSYMSRTLIRQYPYTDGEETEELSVLYKFIPDVTVDANHDGEPDCDNRTVDDGGPVTISLQSVSGGSEVITDYEVADADVNGWREITISTVSPSANLKTQYLRISGQVGGNNPLYRNITYTMLNTQTMQLQCVPSKVQNVSGQDLEVDIGIPKNLPSSMFPLIFYIESDQMSLTPDNSKEDNNLPVTSGTSIINGNNNTTFHFVRTLSETEYLRLENESSTNTAVLRCYFLTNKGESASTVHVVDEDGYFSHASVSFTNFKLKNFTNLTFTNGVSSSSGASTPFSFELDDSDPLPPRVYLQLKGLRPTGDAGLSHITNTSDPYYDWYWYSPTETTVASLRNSYSPIVYLATTTTTGNAMVYLNADEYAPAWQSTGYAAQVTLNKSETAVRSGSTETLTATVLPSNATNKSVTWSSSDTSVATVSSSGVVTGVSRGKAVITATTVEGGYSASCEVTVTQRVTINTTNGIFSTGTDKSYTRDGVTLEFSRIYVVNASYIRPYNSSTIKITAGGASIRSVVITYSANNYTYNFSVQYGSASLSGTTWTWTGDSGVLVLTCPNNNTRRIASISVDF